MASSPLRCALSPSPPPVFPRVRRLSHRLLHLPPLLPAARPSHVHASDRAGDVLPVLRRRLRDLLHPCVRAEDALAAAALLLLLPLPTTPAGVVVMVVVVLLLVLALITDLGLALL